MCKSTYLRLFLSLLIAASLGGISWSESAQPKSPIPQSKESPLNADKGDKQQKPTDKPSTFNQKPTSPVSSSATDKKAKQQNPEPIPPIDYGWWFNFALAVFTGALVLIGGIQAFIYRRQARYMRDGLKQTQIAADAARRSADTADKSLRLLERAWIDVAFEELLLLHDRTLIINCNILNTGRTPALVKERVVDNPVVSDALPAWSIKEKPTGPMPTIMTIPAGQSMTVKYRLEPITKEGITQIEAGQWFLTIRGWIIYDDLFSIRHVTRFYRTYQKRDIGSKGDFIVPVEANPEHNDAD